MTTLLRSLEGPGQPRDYLLARLHGRRTPGRDHWQALCAELRWLLPQCDPAWRSGLAPLLELLEARTLATALRLRLGGDGDGARQALAGSLLRPELVDLLTRSAAAELPARLAAACALLPRSARLSPLAAPRQVEALLYDRILGDGVAHGREPAMRLLLSVLIEARNLLAIDKALLREGVAAPPLLAGGLSGVAQLQGIWGRRDRQALLRRGRGLGVAMTRSGWIDQLPQLLRQRLRAQASDPLSFAALLTLLGARWQAADSAAAGEAA